MYRSVGDFFRERFSEEYAGLAHNTLFLEELKDFKPLHKKGGMTHKKRRAALWSGEDKKGRPPKTETKIKKGGGKVEVKDETVEVKNDPKASSVLLRLPRRKKRRAGDKKEQINEQNV